MTTTYLTAHTGNVTTFATANYTWAVQGIPQQAFTVQGIGFFACVTNPGTVQGVLYADTGALLASSTVQSLTTTSGTWCDLTFTTPYRVTAGTTYRFGVFTNGTAPYGATWGGTDHLHTDASGLYTLKFHGQYHSAGTGNVFPTTAYTTYEFELRLALQADAPPNAPIVTGTWSGGNWNLSWTYSDPDSDPQTKYQVQYRPWNTGGAWTTLPEVTSASTSAAISASALYTDGGYEVQVRVADAFAGYGPWSASLRMSGEQCLVWDGAKWVYADTWQAINAGTWQGNGVKVWDGTQWKPTRMR